MFRLVSAVLRMAEELAIIDSAARTVRVLLIQAGLGLAAGLLALAAISCGLAGLWMWALLHYGTILAPLIVAGTLLLATLIVLIIMARVGRSKRRPRTVATAARNSVLEPMRLMTAAAHGFLQGLSGENVRRP